MQPDSESAVRRDANREVHRLDGGVRMVLWGGVLYMLVQQMSAGGTWPPSAYLLPLAAVVALSVGYLLLSIWPVAEALRREADKHPVLMSSAPLLFLVPYFVFARQDPDFDPSTILASAMLLFLPAACAVLNTPQLRRHDIAIGLITVALPLVIPLIRNESVAREDMVLRLSAYVLPVALLVFTAPAQRQRLHFLFACAVLSLWYSVEFSAFPTYILPNTPAINYFHWLTIPTFLYVVALANRFEPLGLSFKPSLQGAWVVLMHLALAAMLVIPLGLAVGFLNLSWVTPQPIDTITQLFSIYLFIALPEELLFRGVLLAYLKETLDWPVWVCVAVSSLIFGLAHLNNSADIGGEASVYWYALLAAFAGVAYASAYLRSKNVTAAAAVHTLVNWLWGVAFK
jgi:membrane protease YdiL (CAAX protease family)